MIASFWSWLAGNKWARDLAVALGMIGGLLVGERIYRMNVESGVKRRMKDKQARQNAEVRLRVNERSTEIINEERQNADAALQARDHSPDYPSSDSVPDPVARVIFRD